VTAPSMLRSVLFCPANEPRKVRHLSASGADAVVLDLEDAVALGEKVGARKSAREALPTLSGVFRTVRVNAFDTGFTTGDVEAVVCADLDAIILPKVETAQDLRRIDRLIARAEAANDLAPGSVRVIAIVETCGHHQCHRDSPKQVAAHVSGVRRRRPRQRSRPADLARRDLTPALAYGRAKLVYDARAAGLPPPLDGPFMKVRDQAALEEDCTISRGLGHRGRICIHPDQVPVVNRMFAPDPDEVAFARRVIDAFASAGGAGSAAITVDGVFVDYPIVYKAERIVAMADAIAAREASRKGPTRR